MTSWDYNKVRYYKYRNQVLDILGRKCSRCGFDNPFALQIDHINGGGVGENKRGTMAMYKRYATNSALAKQELQVLCANCNWIKKHEKKEQPWSQRASPRLRVTKLLLSLDALSSLYDIELGRPWRDRDR